MTVRWRNNGLTNSVLKKSFLGFFSWKSEKRGFRFSSFFNHYSFLKNGGTSMYRYIRPLKIVFQQPDKGFTLIEILVVIVIASAIGAVLTAPYFISARALGPGAVADQGRLSFMTQGQMELFRSEISALSSNQWTSSIATLAAASPYRAADGYADGKTFTVSRSVACFNRDLATGDQSCSLGYALISVTVSELRSGQSLTLSFVKTREGL